MVGAHYLQVLSALASAVIAQDPFYMCTDNKCEKCPSAVASSGTGYPDCVIYNSEDVFANQGYEGSEGGGYDVFFDVQEHEPGCATIIKSPAATDLKGCGVVIGAFKQEACVLLQLETSFMVQTCCGTDCDSAGAKKIRGVGAMGTARSVFVDGRGGVLLKDANGTIIEPAEIGPPKDKVTEIESTKDKVVERKLQKRSCTKNSWKGGEILTKPAPNVQIIKDSVNGPSTVTEGRSRTQSWSTSMSLGVADVLSLGVSTEFSESETSSSDISVTILAGQSGKLGFTATLSCSTGKGTCDDEEVEGEVCWPTMSGDDVAGTYRVIVES